MPDGRVCFHKIAMADAFCIFDGVQFERKGYSNRVQIKSHHGVQWLTVPVAHGHGERVLLKDAVIIQDGWQRKHVKAIEVAYRKAPHFDQYFDMLAKIISTPWHLLAELNECLLRYLLVQLGIFPTIVTASDYEFRGEKSALVLDMCVQLGATQYIFGSQGRQYADVPAFGKVGVLVQFQDYAHPVYPQQHGDFVAGLERDRSADELRRRQPCDSDGRHEGAGLSDGDELNPTLPVGFDYARAILDIRAEMTYEQIAEVCGFADKKSVERVANGGVIPRHPQGEAIYVVYVELFSRKPPMSQANALGVAKVALVTRHRKTSAV
jgi:hypothetical protein